MKLTHYIYISTALALLTACNSEDILENHTYTVGEAINAITLKAGISEGGAGVQTRAVDDNHASTAQGGGHTNFVTEGTKLTLRVDGIWLGKGLDDDKVSKSTTASIGEKTGKENKHNSITFSTTTSPVEQLYWDDYGTADPGNMPSASGTPDNTGNGREAGLTIYAVAVDGVTSAPSVSSWTALPWNVGTPTNNVIDQSGTDYWKNVDLLTSNNVRSGADGTYKFDDYISDLKKGTTKASNILEFTHAMTKITVNLYAGKGFPGYSSEAPVDAKFQTSPSVTLLGFNHSGNVNVETKVSTPTANTTANIKMHLADGGANNHLASFDALVFPGNTFAATIGSEPDYKPTSSTNILELNADGNIYKVTAAQLVKAIVGTSTTGDVTSTPLLQAKNYILNVIVNKTEIEVTATIKNWEDVPTEDVYPKINIQSTYGYTVTEGGYGVSEFTKDYNLYRSTTIATGYDEDSGTDGINPAAQYISSAWNKTIYWPDHRTHFFFRGVYPASSVISTVSDNDVIAVTNGAYSEGGFPSDLAIAIPRKTDGSSDEKCKSTAHTQTDGICATEGKINLNFEYAMSKIEVRLKSSAGGDGHIDLTKDNTKVEIIGGYEKARIKLFDGLHDTYTEDDKADGVYALKNLATPVSGWLVTTCDAVVPQEIGNDVIFRITVTDNKNNEDTSDDTTDVYECKVNLIKVKNSETAVSEWIHDKYYVYELDVNKTKISVTATLKDWVTVSATDNIWF